MLWYNLRVNGGGTMLKFEKIVIMTLLILWLLTKPFRYLKYTNITITIVLLILFTHYLFLVLKENRSGRLYKICEVILRMVIILSAVVFLLTQIMIYITPYKDSRFINEKEIDYIIVLGAGLRGKELSNTLKFRLDRLLEMKLDDDTLIVVSGGQGADELVTEASAMMGYLVENGIDKDKIILEEKSTSTFENFKYSLEILTINEKEYDDESNFAVVTNDFHIFRAKYILSRLGYKSIGVAAKTPATVKVDYFFREFFAIIHTVLFDFK